LADDGAGDGAAHGRVQVRGEAALGLDGGEVLGPVAGAAAQVLPEPVHQLGEMQGVQRGAPVVVARGVDRCAVAPHPPVGPQGQGQEHRGPVGLAVRRLVHPPDRPLVHRQPGQLGYALASPSRPHPPAALGLVLVPLVLHLGQVLVVICGPVVFRFSLEVPALPALLHPQPPGPVGARGAPVLAGGAAPDRHHADLAGLQVCDPGDHRAGAHALCHGRLMDQLGAECGVHAAAARVGWAPSRLAVSVSAGGSASRARRRSPNRAEGPCTLRRHFFASKTLDPAPPPKGEAAKT
jgi:hypothetical protein